MKPADSLPPTSPPNSAPTDSNPEWAAWSRRWALTPQPPWTSHTGLSRGRQKGTCFFWKTKAYFFMADAAKGGGIPGKDK